MGCPHFATLCNQWCVLKLFGKVSTPSLMGILPRLIQMGCSQFATSQHHSAVSKCSEEVDTPSLIGFVFSVPSMIVTNGVSSFCHTI